MLQLQRQEYILNKVMFDKQDEDDSGLTEDISLKTDGIVIRITDDDPL